MKHLSKRRSKEKYFIAQVAASEKATAQTYFLKQSRGYKEKHFRDMKQGFHSGIRNGYSALFRVSKVPRRKSGWSKKLIC